LESASISSGSGSAPAASPANDERALVAAVLRRDRKATAEFVERFSDAVYSYVVWRMAPRTDAAEDVVQDVFIAAWKGLAQYHGEAALTSWLLGIARHKIQDYYRRTLRQAEVSDEGAEETSGEIATDRAVFERERAIHVRRALDALPEMYRVVLLWRYWDGQSAAEIARAIGRTEKAVERLLFRARQQMRELCEGLAG
jgi:RNA polymerase sigma-70 factor (ECF subfamily)